MLKMLRDRDSRKKSTIKLLLPPKLKMPSLLLRELNSLLSLMLRLPMLKQPRKPLKPPWQMLKLTNREYLMPRIDSRRISKPQRKGLRSSRLRKPTLRHSLNQLRPQKPSGSKKLLKKRQRWLLPSRNKKTDTRPTQLICMPLWMLITNSIWR